MESNWDDFVESLIDDEAPAAISKKKVDEPRYPCQQCGGTGVWQGGRVNQYGNSKCNACGGRGYFTTTPAQRMKARHQRQNRKQQSKMDGINTFKAAQPDMFNELRDAYSHGHHSDFITSLANQLFSKGTLSDRQVAAWHRGKEKQEAAKKARDSASSEVDLTPIREMFERSVQQGYKSPKYRAEGLVISRAPDYGRNPGALYVKNEADEYGGKILQVQFTPSRDGMRNDFASYSDVSLTAAQALSVIAKAPAAAAIAYGSRTGRCACCGRELTNDVSITRGIGPICAERWGLGDMKSALTKEEAKAELEKAKKELGLS